jgi:hypothetical protein
MNPKPNQRQFPRRASYIIAEYTIKNRTHRDVIKYIGAGGLFVRTSRRVAVGQPIVIRFPLFRFDNTIQVSGKVVRLDRDGFAVSFDNPIDGLICKEGHFPEIVHEGDRSTEK